MAASEAIRGNGIEKKPSNTVKPVYRGHAIYNGHLVIADTFFIELAESRSNSHRKSSI